MAKVAGDLSSAAMDAQIRRFIDSVQLLADPRLQFAPFGATDGWMQVERTVEFFPPSLTPIEATVVRHIATTAFCQLVTRTGVHARLEASSVAQMILNISSAIGSTEQRRAYEMAVETLRNHMPSCARPYTDSRIGLALQFISRNASRNTLRLEQVAAAISISRWHLARLLRRETGHSFGEHIRECRIRRAVSLLDRPILSVKEVAAQVGYSVPQLERAFARALQTTPSRWRAQKNFVLSEAHEIDRNGKI
jgi:AraC-like DNA-binding protein